MRLFYSLLIAGFCMAGAETSASTFTFTGGSSNGTSYTATVDGVTMTVTLTSDKQPITSITHTNIGSYAGANQDAIYAYSTGQTDSITSMVVTFSEPIAITSFLYGEGDGSHNTGTTTSSVDYLFAVTDGSGSDVIIRGSNDQSINEFTYTSGAAVDVGVTVGPSDWTSVTTFTVNATSNLIAGGTALQYISPILDEIVFEKAAVTSLVGSLSSEDIELFPNPSNNEVNLIISSELNSDVEVIILDVTGAEIYSANYSALGGIKLDVSNYEAGIYYTRVLIDDQQIVKKFVVN